ncbi:MAG: HD domain-containing phosphohydrolase [bacterium]
MDNSTVSHQEYLDLKEQIQKLNAIGIALSSEHDLNKLLDLIVTEARNFTNADGGSLYIKEDGKLYFAVAQTESLQKRDGNLEPFRSFSLPLTKESIAGYVAVTGELLNLDDVYDIPPSVEYRVNKIFDKQNKYRSKSMLAVPMQDHDDEIIGVLQLINSLDSRGNVIPFRPEYESIILSLASQAAVAIKNVKLIEEIKNVFRSLVRYSVKAIDARSPHTAGHSGRVSKYCVRMAQAINDASEGRLGQIYFSEQEVEEIRMAGWLHDIGKIGVRESVLEKTNKLSAHQIEVISERFEGIKSQVNAQFIEKKFEALLENNTVPDSLDAERRQTIAEIDEALNFIKRINIPGYLKEEERIQLKKIAEKTYLNSRGRKCTYLTHGEHESLSVIRGNLTESEYEEMQSHVLQTISILDKIPFTKDLQNISRYAAGHHEFLDGTGYPLGLSGDEIPIQSRIMCIADVFDALSSPDRPYKEAHPVEEALNILRDEARAGKLDSDIVELFIVEKLYQRRPFELDED